MCACMNTNQTNHKLMELNEKEMYCCPEARVFEVKTEGVICLSPGNGIASTREGYGEAIEENW